MSFVFSAANQEDKRQNETEKREKQKALSKISAQAQLNITESKLQPDKNTTRIRAQNKFMLIVKRKKNPKPNNHYHVALQHNLTHRSQNIPWKGSTIISLYSSTKGEMP